jgi:hypothetical protein
LSRSWPSTAEAATLRFLMPLGGLGFRVLAAAALFVAGVLFFSVAPLWIAPLGLVSLIVGHLTLWVRTQTTSPGGATPAHEELWAPVEDEWLTRVEDLERRGARWDTTPWDVSNGLGCLTFLALLGTLAAAAFVLAPVGGAESVFRFVVAAAFLLVPLWVNGMRTTWNPSELRKKGEALAEACKTAERLAQSDFDAVPTLALREGRRGKYPVDARLMLRPSREDATGFLGVQLQVALNNVQGTDYPYLYAVVLGKDGFRLPEARPRETIQGVDLVFEPGKGEGVRYLVVRQHADRQGGWHTKPEQISTIVAVALERARAAWRSAADADPAGGGSLRGGDR